MTNQQDREKKVNGFGFLGDRWPKKKTSAIQDNRTLKSKSKRKQKTKMKNTMRWSSQEKTEKKNREWDMNNYYR